MPVLVPVIICRTATRLFERGLEYFGVSGVKSRFIILFIYSENGWESRAHEVSVTYMFLKELSLFSIFVWKKNEKWKNSEADNFSVELYTESIWKLKTYFLVGPLVKRLSELNFRATFVLLDPREHANMTVKHIKLSIIFAVLLCKLNATMFFNLDSWYHLWKPCLNPIWTIANNLSITN